MLYRDKKPSRKENSNEKRIRFYMKYKQVLMYESIVEKMKLICCPMTRSNIYKPGQASNMKRNKNNFIIKAKQDT